ncbi:hypothetical protein B0H13DRAFT_1854665 [Mycena leptocephala]|nr:hypothetical protein B0H13DRAFT_1854665 [Mycena leptocephala]
MNGLRNRYATMSASDWSTAVIRAVTGPTSEDSRKMDCWLAVPSPPSWEVDAKGSIAPRGPASPAFKWYQDGDVYDHLVHRSMPLRGQQAGPPRTPVYALVFWKSNLELLFARVDVVLLYAKATGTKNQDATQNTDVAVAEFRSTLVTDSENSLASFISKYLLTPACGSRAVLSACILATGLTCTSVCGIVMDSANILSSDCITGTLGNVGKWLQSI